MSKETAPPAGAARTTEVAVPAEAERPTEVAVPAGAARPAETASSAEAARPAEVAVPAAAVRRCAESHAQTRTQATAVLDDNPYAFVSHQSAVEALRSLSATDIAKLSRWPAKRRILPVMGQCVTTQRQFKRLIQMVDLPSHGIVSAPVDLLTPSPYLRGRGKGARFHVWERPLAVRSMLRLEKNLLSSGPAMVAVEFLSSQAKLNGLFDAFYDEMRTQAALLKSIGVDESPVLEMPTHWEQMRRVVAVAVLMTEFAGSYRLPVGKGAIRYHAPRLLRVDDIRQMADDPSARFIASRLITVSQLAFDNSASPRETALALMLSAPLDFGGFGLPKPQLNQPIDTSMEHGAASDRDVVTPDLAWMDHRVVLEYDSGEFHGTGEVRRLGEDAVRANTLAAMGFTVLRATLGSVGTLSGIELLARQVARCLKVELGQPTDIQLVRRHKVFGELMLGRR